MEPTLTSSESARCIFNGRNVQQCGASSLSGRSEYVSLKSCCHDMTKHLSGCHVSVNLCEYEVLLARAGVFRWKNETLQHMVVCPIHRDQYGKYWRSPTSCQYPNHKDKVKKSLKQNRHLRVVNVNMSKEIMDIYGVTVPIGSPICSTCRMFHAANMKPQFSEEINQAYAATGVEERETTATESVLDETTDTLSYLSIAASTPEVKRNDPCWTPGVISESILSGSSQEEDGEEASPLDTLNTTLTELSGGTFSPLTFQLNCNWDEASPRERELCLEKAEEACQVICDIIAPKDGQSLFASLLKQSYEPSVSDDLVALFTAFANAPTRRLKIQILSIYAYRYPINTLMKLHEPYAKVSKWQIKLARSHARLNGPGALRETKKQHRVRVDAGKMDHFIDFIDRSYFYQDVAFGMRVLTLESGEKIEMPNIVRVVTRSTMVALYMKFCEKEGFSPLSRSTMFRILDVREASQRTSLRGLDNIAADGSVGFQTLERIVNDLEQAGVDKVWATETRNRLKDGKLYLKVGYPVHCSTESSQCKDHCRNFALSDPTVKDFQQHCDHEHIMKCDECEDVKQIIIDIEETIRKQCSGYNFDEHRGDLLHDLKQASQEVFAWKAHILRSVNQNKAKTDILNTLDDNTVLIVMDWAMKYLPTRYREKQSDWFGKRGLSWHISSVVSKSEGRVRTQSYVHLLDSCNQEWFSVTSIVENMLTAVRKCNPSITRAYLRSDEAGCYHNNMLIAACRDLSQLTGVEIIAYHFSEPQQGKDICDRIICPLKASMKRYCNEGNDVITASDMHKALVERPVRGTTACVCKVNEAQNTLTINKLDGFSRLHNFCYEKSGLRVWRAYGIGSGKVIKDKSIYVHHLQQAPLLEVVEGQDFFLNNSIRELVLKDDSVSPEIQMFECTQPGCTKSFGSLSDLELHLDVGDHQNNLGKGESLYDSLRRGWASKFSNISNLKVHPSTSVGEHLLFGESGEVSEGWALSLTSSSARFPDKVKEYLISKFDEGEKTGKKTEPGVIEQDMRKLRNENGERIFSREEWLKSSQIKGFFSRLAASRRKQRIGQSSVDAAIVDEVDEEEAIEFERQEDEAQFISLIQNSIGLRHPIAYEDFNICELYAKRKLSKLTVAVLKEILDNFEITYSSKDKKQDLLEKVQQMVKECTCFTQR